MLDSDVCGICRIYLLEGCAEPAADKEKERKQKMNKSKILWIARNIWVFAML